MKRLLSSLLLAAAAPALMAADPLLGGDAEAGAKKAAVCAACHGPGGNSVNPEWPKLAGQGAPYLYAQLKAYQAGDRKNVLMSSQAANLSEQDMKDLAAYFASQSGSPGVAAESAVATAEPLHRGGDGERSIPACSACHGPAGKGNPASGYPALSGQHSVYSANILRAYRSMDTDAGLSANQAIMASVAKQLSDEEIEALASYFQGLQ